MSQDETGKEPPKILRVAYVGDREISRRRMLQDSGLAAAAVAAGAATAGCGGPSEFDMVVVGGVCQCHFVCTCDAVDDSGSSKHEARWSGGVCTCHTVCTCDTVSGGGGGGGGYYYPN